MTRGSKHSSSYIRADSHLHSELSHLEQLTRCWVRGQDEYARMRIVTILSPAQLKCVASLR